MNKLKLLLHILLMMLCWSPMVADSFSKEIEFNNITNRDGLSNSQINAILQDDKGYVWLGTQAGLNRYDGFRFKTFYYKNLDITSLPNNSIDEIQQDFLGNLWVHTDMGYCIYQYEKEAFERNPEKWLKSVGVIGNPSKILVDCNKNMWFVMYGRGCYFLDTKNMRPHFFSFKDMGVTRKHEVTCITDNQGAAVLSFDDGTLCKLDGLHHKVVWKNTTLNRYYTAKPGGVFTFIDNHFNYWVLSSGFVFIYSSAQKKWYDNMAAFVKGQGIDMPVSNAKILIRDIAKGKDGRLWIATDHEGLILLDYAHRQCKQYTKIDGVKGALPDNSLQRVYVDRQGALWVGTYKNGVAYYSPSFTKFSTLSLGDVCTITQDKWGNYWCGTNDAGIICYNPATGQKINFGSAQTGLKSDIVVSSVTMSDGTMYFGTFNGGLARYRNGEWKVYLASPHGLCNNSVWSLLEDSHHRLVIGTLGGGVQFMDTEKETFKTLDVANSKLPSNYIASLSKAPGNQILIAHSQNITLLNVDNFKMTSYDSTRSGEAFPSPAVNDAIVDSRGIFWLATPAGIAMYDPKSGQMESVNELNGTQGAVGCAVVEDRQNTIWLISEFVVTHVKLHKDKQGKWDLQLTSYNSMDGLQERQFNYRAAYVSHEGNIIIGGQDGINVIRPQMERNSQKHVKALFSGIVLFDHPLSAGEEYEGRVVLDEALDECRRLNLRYNDKAFTIQLASSDVMIPSRNRFLYRMEGVSDKWMLTAEGRPEVTFTNLSAGSYTLQVKVVNGDGSVCDDVSELKIHVQPPFYFSVWAFLVYIFLIGAAVYYYRKRALDKQKMRFEHEKMEENIRKDRELNELKLNFFTNVSHELRTPLTLIISPLANMIKKEENDEKKRKLELIYRNAVRLLNLVNQLLDFRKIEQNKGKLSLGQVEVVSFVNNICNSFQMLGNSKINLVFHAEMDKLMMSFDADKVGKIVNNLLSNAYKFTPDGGSVTVTLEVVKGVKIKDSTKDVLRLQVADTGKGISDEDKVHIFDRFYQVNGTEMQPYGGSGIGLNLVRSFAELHGGQVQVADNPQGGTIFTVDLPFVALPSVPQQQDKDRGGEKPLVLLVDDSDDFREFMRDVLTENYRVIEAVNGQEGWNLLQKQRPDIILSDVMMPVMDGNEFCRLVKETPKTASIPFVMLTARLADEHKKEGLQNGADEYITKPFDIDLLNLRIQNLMKWAKRSEVQGDNGVATTSSTEALHVGEVLVGEAEQVPKVEEYVMTESDRKFINSVDTYIRDNMGDPDTSVESMSSHLCISRVQLYKRMVSLTGTTPSEYLRAKRIHRSEEMLHTNEFTISEIAYKVGFNNPRYFSKYFQDEYGVTPSQYRKNLGV